MQRFFVALALVLSLIPTSLAHGDNSHFANKQDVTVKTQKISGNVYMLQGQGGNIGAIAGPEGILIVDDDYKAVSQKLSAALKDLGSAIPKFILNTHWHGDHTQGNDFFGSQQSIIIAHANVRKRLIDPPVIFGQKTPPYASHALPMLTYTESMSIHLNGEDITLRYYPNGHTDGDSVVFFKNANVVHLGDDFFVGRFPFVDIDSGGSVQGMINNVSSLLKTIPPDAKLIPGHGSLATTTDLQAYRDALSETAKIVEDQMKAKKTLDEIKKTGLPKKFESFGGGFIKTDRWIETVYRSYSQK
ncbi:MAG: MBL fold metallo-hydrolase [Pyrinomonadaceae bacterium]